MQEAGLALHLGRQVSREGGAEDVLNRRVRGNYGGRTGPGVFGRLRGDEKISPSGLQGPGERQRMRSGGRE